jgi:branched-chain amino acid transport system substrate-binding protein
VSGPVYSADKIKVGFFSILEGPYTALGEDGQRGFDLAVMQHNGKAGGKDLELIRGYSDASPDSALRAAKKLVEQDKVDIPIAPLSGSEGIALRDYAKTQPQVTSMTVGWCGHILTSNHQATESTVSWSHKTVSN